MKTDKQNKSKIYQPLLLSLMVILGMIGGYRLNDIQDDNLIRFFPGDKNISIGEVEEVLRFLDNKYLYETDEEALTEDALHQVFSRLDPYSLYIPPGDLKIVNNNMNGSYKGIGIETLIIEDTLVVANILKGSPAEKTGIQKLDRIISLNGDVLTGEKLDFQRFRTHFQKSIDTSTLEIFRKRNKEILEIKVSSDEVETRSINHYFMVNDTTLYIRIDQFISKTYQEFMSILEENAMDGKIPQLIIDMRNNPGGFLGEVTKILSQFFEESDRTLVKTVMRNGQERKYETTGRTFYEVDKIIALINENSASGSEVLAGALQDWDRGLVLGEQSYGKGLVQEQYPLSNGGAVRITVANYFLPSGRSIQNEFEIDSMYFETDTIWNTADHDYESLILKRPLAGAQGIIPDIIVNDSLFDQLFYSGFYNDQKLEESVISYLESNPDLYNISKEEFSQMEFLQTDGILNRIPDDLDFDDNAGLVQLLFRAKLASYLFNDEYVLTILLKNDPVLGKAIEKMSERSWFNRVIEEN